MKKSTRKALTELKTAESKKGCGQIKCMNCKGAGKTGQTSKPK